VLFESLVFGFLLNSQINANYVISSAYIENLHLKLSLLFNDVYICFESMSHNLLRYMLIRNAFIHDNHAVCAYFVEISILN